MNSILIVEDSILQCQLLMILVGRLYPEAKIDTANNFSSAVDCINNNKYDLFFSDVDLSEEIPERNGYSLAGLIRSDSRNAASPIIFTTATSSNPAHVAPDSQILGKHSFLIKPFDSKQIEDAIQRAINPFPYGNTIGTPLKKKYCSNKTMRRSKYNI